MEHVLEIESIPSMSLKKTAISFFTPLGYRYITGKDQVHILRKINGYHHGIEVEMDRAPLSKRIASYLHFIGYNFYLTYCLPDFTPLNQEQLDEFVRCVAQITDYMEKQCTELLYECFGSTPEWYVY